MLLGGIDPHQGRRRLLAGGVGPKAGLVRGDDRFRLRAAEAARAVSGQSEARLLTGALEAVPGELGPVLVKLVFQQETREGERPGQGVVARRPGLELETGGEQLRDDVQVDLEF